MAWQYALTPTEEGIAAKVGFERQLPMLGQPERNRNYSEGDIWEMWQHGIAAGSEIAAARMLGLMDFVPHVNTYKSRQDIPNYEIRYCFTKRTEPKWGLRYRSDVDKPQEVYILITGGPEYRARRNKENNYSPPPYKAVGWMYGFECQGEQYKVRGTSYLVPYTSLHPMEQLPDEGIPF